MILFAAIAIPEKIARDIARVQRGVSGAKWRTADRLHITLGYFGSFCIAIIHGDVLPGCGANLSWNALCA